MTTLFGRLHDFVAALRAAGIRVSVGETMDAMRAVAAVGLWPGPMREALAAALVKDEADRSLFDRIFDRCFSSAASRGKSGQPAGATDPQAAGQGRAGASSCGEKAPSQAPDHANADHPRFKGKAAPAPRRHADPHALHSLSGRDELSAARGIPAGVQPSPPTRGEAPAAADRAAPFEDAQPGWAARAARMRALELKPFAAYTEVDYAAAREALEKLRRLFQTRPGRRLARASFGQLDFRRTIRAGLQRGGVMAELKMRARRPDHAELLLLADLSGSVRYAAELALELTATLGRCFRRLQAFAYVDRLSEASFERGYLVLTPPLDLYARSDFGLVLEQLWRELGPTLNRQTVVVILGDGRNNRRPPRLELLRALGERCRAVVWLSPEPRERWGIGDSALLQYAREVDALVSCENLRQLSSALVRLPRHKAAGSRAVAGRHRPAFWQSAKAGFALP